jgi:HlyD family secretion protein
MTAAGRRIWPWAIVIPVLVALLLVAGWLLLRPGPRYLQGQVEATELSVAAKIAGRVDSLLVREGQSVAAGQLLAVIDSPEIHARLRQAEGAEVAASAQRDKADRGARDQEISQARSGWQRAEAAHELAAQTWRRIDNLHAEGVVPAQRRDEAQANLRAAAEAAQAARAVYDLAREGVRTEDRQAAAGLADQAGGAVDEVRAFLAETRLHAPRAAEVATVVVEPGELVAPGFPLVILVDLDDLWVTFNVREDRLPGLEMGRRLEARIPALGDRKVELQVSSIAVLGDFATWRAASASGEFDLRTFEVRARPSAPVTGLRPGMSALVPRQ